MYKQESFSDNISIPLEATKSSMPHTPKENNVKPNWFILDHRTGKTLEEIHGPKKARAIKQKISNYFKNRPKSQEHKDKIRKAHLGFEHSNESKQKMSETRKRLFKEGKWIPPWKGKKCPELSKRNMEKFLGKTFEEIYGLEKAEEIRKKSSVILRRLYAEGRMKPNMFWLGRKHTEEEKIKISRSNFGKKKSPEHIKKMSLAQKGKQALDKNPRWLGGISFLPYPVTFNRTFKEAIRIRDAFLCLKCGMREEDSLILLKRRLTCHHIDYIKGNTFKENCCALCQRCNIEVNINRPHWTKFFQSLLSERYGYKYSEDGKVIVELNSEKVN